MGGDWDGAAELADDPPPFAGRHSSTGAARVSDTVSAVASGDPRRAARRARNVAGGARDRARRTVA